MILIGFYSSLTQNSTFNIPIKIKEFRNSSPKNNDKTAQNCQNNHLRTLGYIKLKSFHSRKTTELGGRTVAVAF